MLRYLLALPDGEPNEPPTFVTPIPNWSVGEIITLGNGEQLRIVQIADQIAEPLVQHGLSGIFTVEPV